MRVAGIEHRLSSMSENALYTLSHFSTLLLLLLLLFKIYVCVLSTCMHVHHMYAVLTGAWRGCQIPCKSSRQL